MSRPDLSVVIGFRDWGADRLRLSVASLHGAVGALEAEIIISDYGSADPSVSRQVAEDAGARWVHTASDPVWSRSRALNAGFRIARGDLLVSTDADMLFSPGSLEVVHAEAVAAAPCAVFLQCRDLPESLAVTGSDTPGDVPWHLLDRHSRLRPRWGMGGMMAIDREGFARLHGFDERLHTYGREDLDFALRARRAGWRTRWVQDTRARMYHMWHPPTLSKMESSADGLRTIDRNRRLVDSDATTARNVTMPSPPLEGGQPLVSIIITEVSTEEDLIQTLATACAQSVRNLEILVVGNGRHTDGATANHDPRVRSIHVLNDEDPIDLLRQTRGVYVSIVRCGDLLPLQRTEMLLATMTEGRAGVRGRIALAREDASVEVGRPGDDATDSLLMTREAMGVVLMARSALPTIDDLVDGSIRRAGLAIGACDAPVTLTLQERNIAIAKNEEVPAAVVAELRALLPAPHPAAVPRRATLRAVPEDASSMGFDGAVSLFGVRHGGDSISGGLVVDGASYADLASMSRTGGQVDVLEALPDPDPRADHGGSWLEAIVGHAISQGAELPLALHRTPDRPSVRERQDAYTVYDGGRTFGILAAVAEAETDDHPWIVIGRDIEEIWA